MSDEKPRVLAILLKGMDGCLLWRNWWPSAEVEKHGYVADWMYANSLENEIEPALRSGRYNIVLTPRFVFRETWMRDRFIRLIRDLGLVWIYEVDDDMFSEDIVMRNIAYNTKKYLIDDPILAEQQEASVIFQATEEQQERIAMLQFIDGLIASTDPLADIARRYTAAPVHVVPNAMNIDWFSKYAARTPRAISQLTVGWSGGWRSEQDISVFGPVWGRLASRYPNLHFVLHGWAAPSIVEFLPANRLHVLDWSDIEDYPSTLKNIDIGCCSVVDSHWNQAKSCIKWMEMSMSGAAVVGSHALYGRDITDGYDGLLASSSEQWEQQLRRLIDDASLRRSIHVHAVQTITEKHNIASSWTQWVNAWSSILSEKKVTTS